MENNVVSLLRETLQAYEEDGDYYKDGLLYCGKCNTPKSQRLKGEAKEMFGEIVYKECLCERQRREEMERKEEQRKLAERRKQAVTSKWIANDGYLKYTFEHDADAKISERYRTYVQNFEDMRQKNVGLMLYGPCDSAKSFYAACICNALFDKGYSVVIDTMSNLCRRIQDFDEEQRVLDMIRYASIVFIDDIAAEAQSGYNLAGAYRLIDERVTVKRPLIVTTNLTLPQIKAYRTSQSDVMLQRIYSRLAEACVPIEAAYSPRTREAIGKDKADYFEKICGGGK